MVMHELTTFWLLLAKYYAKKCLWLLYSLLKAFYLFVWLCWLSISCKKLFEVSKSERISVKLCRAQVFGIYTWKRLVWQLLLTVHAPLEPSPFHMLWDTWTLFGPLIPAHLWLMPEVQREEKSMWRLMLALRSKQEVSHKEGEIDWVKRWHSIT